MNRTLWHCPKFASSFWHIQALFVGAYRLKRCDADADAAARVEVEAAKAKETSVGERGEVVGWKHGLEDADLGLFYAGVCHLYAPAKCSFARRFEALDTTDIQNYTKKDTKIENCLKEQKNVKFSLQDRIFFIFLVHKMFDTRYLNWTQRHHWKIWTPWAMKLHQFGAKRYHLATLAKCLFGVVETKKGRYKFVYFFSAKKRGLGVLF